MAIINLCRRENECGEVAAKLRRKNGISKVFKSLAIALQLSAQNGIQICSFSSRYKKRLLGLTRVIRGRYAIEGRGSHVHSDSA